MHRWSACRRNSAMTGVDGTNLRTIAAATMEAATRTSQSNPSAQRNQRDGRKLHRIYQAYRNRPRLMRTRNLNMGETR